jgi:hypothetical protein
MTRNLRSISIGTAQPFVRIYNDFRSDQADPRRLAIVPYRQIAAQVTLAISSAWCLV